MLIVKGFLFIIWFLVSPFLIGFLFRDKVMRQSENGFAHALVTGYLLLFAIFYLITMPLLVIKASLSWLVFIFASINIILSLLSIAACYSDIIMSLRGYVVQVKRFSVIMMIAILIIVFQTSVLTFYQHIDDDDAFYVATSTTAVETNTIVEIDPFTGNILKSHRMRYVMSPYPVYTAVMSKLICIHPTIVAHTVFPAVFIPLSFMITYLLIAKFFRRKQEYIEYGLLFFALLTIMGNVSIYTSSTFLLFRIWQGKAMLANIILPSILVYSSDAMDKTRLNSNWILVVAAVLAGCLTSSMAVALVPLSLGLLSIVYSGVQKSIKPIIMSLICLIPCMICGVLYIV